MRIRICVWDIHKNTLWKHCCIAILHRTTRWRHWCKDSSHYTTRLQRKYTSLIKQNENIKVLAARSVCLCIYCFIFFLILSHSLLPICSAFIFNSFSTFVFHVLEFPLKFLLYFNLDYFFSIFRFFFPENKSFCYWRCSTFFYTNFFFMFYFAGRVFPQTKFFMSK